MKYFCCHYKDDPAVWSSFDDKDIRDAYTYDRGGCFTFKEGEKFNPDWIEEEIQSRNEDILLVPYGDWPYY